MRGLSKSVTIEDVEFNIREMTAGEVLDWERSVEAAMKSGGGSATDHVLLDEFSLSDLATMTGLELAEIMAMPPSVLDQLAHACREVNPRFFVVRGVVIRPLKAVLELMSLAAPSAGLSGKAM